MNIHQFGRDAVMIESPTPSALDAHLRRRAIPGIREMLPTEDSLLIRTHHAVDPGFLDALRRALAEVNTEAVPAVEDSAELDAVRIPVTYDGADLFEVAQRCSMGTDTLVRLHSDIDYRVAFCGFAPGFAYLTGLPERLRIPRRDTPRTSVPAGSVAIAAHYSAVYPRSSPGGWHLLGRTDRAMFDPDRRPPALLEPGMRVRFDPVRDAIATGSDAVGDAVDVDDAPTHDLAHLGSTDGIEIVEPGVSCLIEDLGRVGWGRVAVSPSGAWDLASHRLAQRLLGNAEDAAGLECLAGGLRLRATEAATVAVTGAPGPLLLERNGSAVPVAMNSPLHLRRGDELLIGTVTSGLRRYVGIRGGIAIAETLGSRSHDTLSGLGPAPLRCGDRLVPGAAIGPIPGVDVVTDTPIGMPVGVIAGPWWNALTEQSRLDLAEGAFTVSPRSDRIGVRLAGPALDWIEQPPRATASRAMVKGAIQVPPDGQPVVLGPDHPATGGYPVIGVLADPDAAAQWAPGVRVHLREVVPFRFAPRAASSTGRAADS